jgi:hypothetical protein
MPSFLPTDDTPTDVDDFGYGVDVGVRPKGMNREYMRCQPGGCEPGVSSEPHSQLPEGGEVTVEQGKRAVSELPTDGRVEETTNYQFGNPRSMMETVVDNDAPWIYPNETEPTPYQVSGRIRGLAASLKGGPNG